MGGNVQAQIPAQEGKLQQPDVMAKLAALNKVLHNGPLARSNVSIAPFEKISLSIEEVAIIRTNLEEVRANVQRANKEIEDALGVGASKQLAKIRKWGWIGRKIADGIDKRRIVRTEALVKHMEENNVNNLAKLEGSQIKLVNTSQNAYAFRDTIDTLLECIRTENWSVSEIENTLTILSGKRLDTSATAINTFVETILPPENIIAEREKLIGQIDAIRNQTTSAIKVMNGAVLVLRSVRQEVLAVSVATKALAEPAVQLEAASLIAMKAGEDSLITGQGILMIFANAVDGLNRSLDAVKVLQEKGIASPEAVQKLETLADQLSARATQPVQ